jgi:hypothetical protein
MAILNYYYTDWPPQTIHSPDESIASISCPQPNVFRFGCLEIGSCSFLTLLDFFVYELSLFKGDFYPYRSCKYFSIPASFAYNRALN